MIYSKCSRKEGPSLYLFIFCFILLNHISTSVQAQASTATNFPELTTEEMLDDFDRFVETVVEFSPQTPVRKAVTGIDPLAELKKIRSSIRKLKSPQEFASLIESAITLLQDGHSSLLWPRGYSSDYLEELGISEAAIELFPAYYDLRTSKAKQKKFNLKLKYIKGEYYSIAPFQYEGVSYDAGLRLAKINGRRAQAYISKLYPYLRRMRWDYKHQRYYSENFYRALNLSSDQSLKLKFIDKDKKVITGVFKLDTAIQYADRVDATEYPAEKVEYFKEEKILYIRIPKMNMDYVDFYPAEIKSKASGKQLDKVIIDIRNNPGGADNVWVGVLAAIIQKPIDFELLLLALPSEGMRKQYPEDAAKWESYQAPFLDNYQYKVFASGPRQIEPDSNSINFDGKIYILLNEGIYSSAGAMAAIGMLADNIYTVGQNTGWLLGRGINPIVFELPNSKILYRIEPVIDFQNVKTAEDVYHDNVEVPVSLNIDEYLQRIYYAGDIYGKEFLLTHDPVFIRAYKD